MANDTLILKNQPGNGSTGAGTIKVSYDLPEGGRQTSIFFKTFTVGREEDCEILLADEVVSKRHLEVYLDDEGWWVRDLGSMNGTYLNGERVQHALISRNSDLRVAPDGPILKVELVGEEAAGKGEPEKVEEEVTLPEMDAGGLPADRVVEGDRPETVPDLSSEKKAEKTPGAVTKVLEKYASDDNTREAGPQTQIMREAFARVKSMESKRYRLIIVGIAILLIGTMGVAVYQHLKLKKLIAMGVDIFYDMKTMEVQVEKMLQTVVLTGETELMEQLAAKREQLETMQKRYDSYLEETGIFGQYTSEEDKLIFRVARLFGECELNVPDDFLKEVKNYIGKWKSTSRLRNAIARIAENDYARRAYRVLVGDHLPPQFLYVALQESDFKPNAVGPKTRFGIAKGFWQFIPSTAAQYGLKTGPLVELPRFDPRDERFDYDKSTIAATKYLRYIYNTEAQASGLLVVASYNWGHNNIRKRIRKMPENPRDRNFWKLLENYKIPKETYDYVFMIFSAAVIAENPGLFGFDFENPIEGLDEIG